MCGGLIFPYLSVSNSVPVSAVKVKAHELRKASKADMLKQLDDLRNELAQVRPVIHLSE